MIDMDRGARLSGSRFAYLKGDLVMLELALVRWALEKLAGTASSR
jgi:seryl-tRNA synthetase